MPKGTVTMGSNGRLDFWPVARRNHQETEACGIRNPEPKKHVVRMVTWSVLLGGSAAGI